MTLSFISSQIAVHFIAIHNVTEYGNTEYIAKIESHVATGISMHNKNYSFCFNQMLFFPLVFFPLPV